MPEISRFRKIFRIIRIVILLAILAFACWYSYIWWHFDNMSQYENWSDGMAISKENGKYGYVDDNFDLVINHQFDYATPFKDRQAIVGINVGDKKRFRVINKKGVYIGQFYDEIKSMGEQNYRVRNRIKNQSSERYDDYQWQIMDNTGKIIDKTKYHRVDDYREGRARVCIDKKCGFIDTKGIRVIPLGKNANQQVAYGVSNFTDGSGVASPFLEYGDFHGYQVNDAEYFSEGLTRTYKDKKVGYIDTQGNIVIQPQFLRAKNFSEGVAVVKTGKGFAVINHQGQFVIPPNPNYQNITSFSEGRAIFTNNAVFDKNKFKGGRNCKLKST